VFPITDNLVHMSGASHRPLRQTGSSIGRRISQLLDVADLLSEEATLLCHECRFCTAGHSQFADNGGDMRLDSAL